MIQTGDVLSARSACDWDTIYRVQVVKRTPKTVTVVNLSDPHGAPTRCKVHTFEGREYVMAFGTYSMAPCFTKEEK